MCKDTVRSSPALIREIFVCVQTFHHTTKDAHGDCQLDNIILYANPVTGVDEVRLIDLPCHDERSISKDILRISSQIYLNRGLRENETLLRLVAEYQAADCSQEAVLRIVDYLEGVHLRENVT